MILSFFFNDTATTEIYTLSLHDALPICGEVRRGAHPDAGQMLAEPTIRGDAPEVAHAAQEAPTRVALAAAREGDRKSTRLNSSHANISYAVFCLKKKKHTIFHMNIITTH